MLKVKGVFDSELFNTKQDHDFINDLLSKEIYNPYYLDRYYLNIDLQVDHIKDLFYRYDRAVNYCKLDPHKPLVCVQRQSILISLTEAMGYIQYVIPPSFKRDFGKLFESIEGIVDMLKYLLITFDPAPDYNIDCFKKRMGIMEFAPMSKYDTGFIDILRDRNPNLDIVIHVQAASNLDKIVHRLKEYDEYGNDFEVPIKPEPIQITINCYNKEQLLKVAQMIQIHTHTRDESVEPWIITDMRRDEKGYYIECTHTAFDPDLYPDIEAIIQEEYKDLV